MPLQPSSRLQLGTVWAPSLRPGAARSFARRHVVSAARGQRGRGDANSARETSSSSKSQSSSSRKASRTGSGKAGSSQERIATVLASAGLDPAELQQQWLDDYSQLTLLLAQLVAKVHRTRVSKAVGTLRVQPADLMARINFLAYEVGLTVNDLKHMLQRHLKFVSFHLESARDLLSWLQAQQVSNKQLQLASRAYPTFWSVDVARLQRSKQHLQQQLSNTDSQWAEGLALQPWALTATTDVVDGVVAWLEAEPLAFGRTELASYGSPPHNSLPPQLPPSGATCRGCSTAAPWTSSSYGPSCVGPSPC